MLLLIFLFTLILTISFICSLLESILLSINQPYISILEEKNPSVGKSLKYLKDNIGSSISSILIINTFVQFFGATLICLQAQIFFENNIVSTLTLSLFLTFMILFLSEIIPKTIGIVYWKKLAPHSSKIINVFLILTFPILQISKFITKKVIKSKEKDTVSREEILHNTLLSEEEGIIDTLESDIIENTLSINETKLREILTPRSVMFAIEKNTPISEILKDPSIYKFSRVPVYDKNIDNIIGMILTKSLLKQALIDTNFTLDSLLLKIDELHEKNPVLKVLKMFSKQKSHMFLVVDSYGQTTGIVTLEDCIESVLGFEIMDELDTTKNMRLLAIRNMKNNRINKN